ncbi:MAG: 1,4-alpha-glucan branching enzyme, partial [Rhodothermales bacterium]
MPWLDKDDFERWRAGSHFNSYEKLGAHWNRQGTWFALWAPWADHVAVLGEFNDWSPDASPLERADAGLWQVFVRGARPGHHYKYRIQRGMYTVDKTDPYAFAMEGPSSGGSTAAGLASIVVNLGYDWEDHAWMESRKGPETLDSPVCIYEVHLGSW